MSFAATKPLEQAISRSWNNEPGTLDASKAAKRVFWIGTSEGLFRDERNRAYSRLVEWEEKGARCSRIGSFASNKSVQEFLRASSKKEVKEEKEAGSRSHATSMNKEKQGDFCVECISSPKKGSSKTNDASKQGDCRKRSATTFSATQRLSSFESSRVRLRIASPTKGLSHREAFDSWQISSTLFGLFGLPSFSRLGDFWEAASLSSAIVSVKSW